MLRIAVIASGHAQWSDSVVAGLAERHDVLRLTLHAQVWHLGHQPLGDTLGASLAAAVSVVCTAQIALPLDADPRVAALCALVGRPVAGSGPAATTLGRDWWTTRLMAHDAGLEVAAGVRVSRAQARGLDYLDPVGVRPSTRGPVSGRTRVTSAEELPLALERAFTYAEHAVVEQALDGARVTVGVLRRPDGAALVAPPYREQETPAGAGAPSWTGEIPVGAGRHSGGGGRTGTRPPLGRGRDDRFPGPDPAPGEAASSPGPGDGITLAQLDATERRRIDRDALNVLTALGAAGASTVTFVLASNGPVLDDVELAPALGPSDPLARLFAAAGTSYPELLDALVAAAR